VREDKFPKFLAMGQCYGRPVANLHETPEGQVRSVELTPQRDLNAEARIAATEVARDLNNLLPPDDILQERFPDALAIRNANQLAGWLFANDPRLTLFRLGGPFIDAFASPTMAGIFLGLTIVVQRGSTILWVFHDKDDDLTPIWKRLEQEGKGKHALEEYTVDVSEKLVMRPVIEHVIEHDIKFDEDVKQIKQSRKTPVRTATNSTNRSFTRRACGHSSIGSISNLSSISGNLVSPV
jgi:hypothetical protein